VGRTGGFYRIQRKSAFWRSDTIADRVDLRVLPPTAAQ